jgi:hypothetical protein
MFDMVLPPVTPRSKVPMPNIPAATAGIPLKKASSGTAPLKLK